MWNHSEHYIIISVNNHHQYDILILIFLLGITAEEIVTDSPITSLMMSSQSPFSNIEQDRGVGSLSTTEISAISVIILIIATVITCICCICIAYFIVVKRRRKKLMKMTEVCTL